MNISPGDLRDWLFEHRRERINMASLVAFCFAIFWLAGNVISPFLAPAGSIHFGDDGIVGAGDMATKISGIDSSFARFFYGAGDANCHQRASRTFFLNGNQMPFCARCTSIFLGLAIGVGIMMFFSLELNILWIIIGLAPMALDGGVQLFTDYESSNLIRTITGGLAGIVTGIALGFIVSEVGKMVVHRERFRKGP